MWVRLIEIFVAASVLALLSPLLLIIALAIVVDSRGNPIYLSRRVGKEGKEFRMWKFRTMVVGAERLGGPITGRGDPRVTRLGRLLRRTKLDELPQFVNVLVGDMALVGPRPESPEIVRLYGPEERAVLRVKPGITGWAQLEAGEESDSIPADVSADEYYVRHLLRAKLRRDLEYLESRTWRSDARAVLATAAFVLRTFLPR